MMSGENVEIVRRFNDAVTRGDREAVATLIHPEVEWRTMAGPLLGVDAVRGRDELLSFIFDVIPEGVEDFGATTERFTELADDQLLVCGHYTGRGTTSGAEIEVASAALYRFEEGMIVSFRDFPSEALALEAATLAE
jgi:ketosteroid isomerase-like protein